MPFTKACSQFIYIENLLQDELDPTTNHSEVIEEPTITKRIKLTQEELRQDEELIKMLVTATYQVANDSGWSNLGTVGQYLMNNNSFSSINYGYKKLGDLIRVIDIFEIDNTTSRMSIKVKTRHALSNFK